MERGGYLNPWFASILLLIQLDYYGSLTLHPFQSLKPRFAYSLQFLSYEDSDLFILSIFPVIKT